MATHKATRTSPYLMSVAALASAAAIVGASPAFVSSESLALGGAPSPTKLVSANYELTALTDITVQGISDAYWFGWGGYIGANNPYYPNVYNTYGPQYVTGVSGVSYYLIDNILDTFTDFDLDNYYFEIGNLNFGSPNAGYSGAGAVIYVGTNELFGTDSPISQLTKTIFYYGTYPTVIGSVVSILQSVVPTFDIGPLEVGGGILATLYFYGATPDGSFNYGTPGLSALLAYVSTAITGLFPTAAATAAPAAAALMSAPDTSAESSSDAGPKAKTVSASTPESGVGGFKSESGAGSAGAAEANGAETESSDVAGGDSVAASADAAGADAASTDVVGADSTGTAVPTGAGESGEASVDANAAAADSGDAGASAGSAAPGKSGHAGKRPNVVSQIAGKVRSALGGANKSGDRGAGSSEGSSQGGSTSSDD